jgi:hypothetical protein
MPWRVRSELYLLFLGAAMVGVASIVLALDQSASSELLGAVAVGSGFAVILNAALGLAGGRDEAPGSGGG